MKEFVAIVLLFSALMVFFSSLFLSTLKRLPWRSFLFTLSFFLVMTAAFFSENIILNFLGVAANDAISHGIIDTLWWIALGLLLQSAISNFIWRGLLTYQGQLLVPRPITHIVALILFFIIFICIVFFVFNKQILPLVTTSGIAILALGFSARESFEATFAALSLNLSKMFAKGDVVQIGNIRGVVVDIGWRNLVMETFDMNLVYFPLRNLTSIPIVNMSRPHQMQFVIESTFDYRITPWQAITVLKRAMSELDEKIEGLVVRFNRYTEKGLVYQIRFYIQESTKSYGQIFHEINCAIYYKVFKEKNVDFGYDRNATASHIPIKPFSDVLFPRISDKESLDLLRKTEIFSSLTEDEFQHIEKHTVRQIFGMPERIVCQGAPGDSMFIVAKGVVAVTLIDEKSGVHEVAQLSEGQYFGEMALLTGEPRTATIRAATDVIVLEIPKKALEGILEQRPQLAQNIAEIVSEKKVKNEEILAKSRAEAFDRNSAKKGLSSAIQEKLLAFFNIKIR